MSLFSRGASPPPPVAAPQPQNVPPMTSMASMTSQNSVNNAEPASHVIHSPLPSRPSPVQPASTIDELLQFHSNSPQPSDAHTPPLPQHQVPPVVAAPIQAQPQVQDRNNMDLLAMLSNPANTASPASVSSSQPVQKPNPVQDQSNAGRMLLDSLLRSVFLLIALIFFQFCPQFYRPSTSAPACRCRSWIPADAA
jgi:hypothetical protein